MKKKSLHVMHIEDNRAHAMLFKHCLEQCCGLLTLTQSFDGMDACMKLFEKQSCNDIPDIIFLDLQMPGVSGFEVLEEIRKNDCLRKIPVVVLSTSDRQQDINRSYELGADDYLVKPLDFASMIDNMQEVLSRCLR